MYGENTTLVGDPVTFQTGVPACQRTDRLAPYLFLGVGEKSTLLKEWTKWGEETWATERILMTYVHFVHHSLMLINE